MYKKISHTIQEEHFNHPSLLPKELAAVYPDSGLPAYVMTENTMLFRMDARTLWSKYVWGLLNYGIGMNNQIPGTDQIEKRLAKNAIALGEFIAPYYGETAGEQFARLLISFSKLGVEVIDATRDKRSLAGIAELWTDVIDQLSTFLNELNPSNWPKSLLADYFKRIVEYWIEEITSRAASDWTANERAIDTLSSWVITGSGTNGGTFGSLADLFSRGIIAQFPMKFLK